MKLVVELYHEVSIRDKAVVSREQDALRNFKTKDTMKHFHTPWGLARSQGVVLPLQTMTKDRSSPGKE